MTEPSESTLKLLGETLDIDAHDMTPSHLWGGAICSARPRRHK